MPVVPCEVCERRELSKRSLFNAPRPPRELRAAARGGEWEPSVRSVARPKAEEKAVLLQQAHARGAAWPRQEGIA